MRFTLWGGKLFEVGNELLLVEICNVAVAVSLIRKEIIALSNYYLVILKSAT